MVHPRSVRSIKRDSLLPHHSLGDSNCAQLLSLGISSSSSSTSNGDGTGFFSSGSCLGARDCFCARFFCLGGGGFRSAFAFAGFCGQRIMLVVHGFEVGFDVVGALLEELVLDDC